MNRKTVIRTLTAIAVVLLLVWSFFYFGDDTRGYKPVDTSVAMAQIQGENVKSAQIDDREQQLRLDLKSGNADTSDSEKIITKYPTGYAVNLFDALQSKNTQVNTVVNQGSVIGSLLIYMLPLLLLVALFVMFSRMQTGGRMGFGFGKSRAKQLSKDMPKTTFADVAGVDEAVEELYEIKDFLQNPARYQALGAKIPKGVLLYGPPGTGKTLLARAVAGEAGVPFFTISGSDFVEMFVGVGASRVRDLFEQAKQNSPCIIFVDEIDAVGRQRGAGLGGGHDEREQTLNQLLVEMDGFGDRQGVILIAATNRPDILDPALLRPGRFDRQIPVSNPDLAGRRAVLRVHSAGKPIAQDADLDGLAKRTVGMSGADLANVINEAALLTARENGTVITGAAMEEAVDRVVGGPRRKSRIISEHEKKITAYHEGGHTLAAWAMPDIEPIYKVTILARGRTGGHALAVPGGRQGADDPLGDDRPAGVRHGRPRGRGTGVPRAHHRRVVRYRPGHQDRPGDGHRIRHERQARCGPLRHRARRPVPGPDHGHAGRLLPRGRRVRSTRRCASSSRPRTPKPGTILTEYRDVLDISPANCWRRRRCTASSCRRSSPTSRSARGSPRSTISAAASPSDKPPIKTPGELAIERGEQWPKPLPEPAFKTAIAAGPASRADTSGTAGRGDHDGAVGETTASGGYHPARLRRSGRLACDRLATAAARRRATGTRRPRGRAVRRPDRATGHPYPPYHASAVRPANHEPAGRGTQQDAVGPTRRHTADDERRPMGARMQANVATPNGTRRCSIRRGPRPRYANCCIAVGEDPDRPGCVDTPARVARAYKEMFAGLYTDPDEVLNTTFDEQHDELVLVKEIPMYSTCEHHLVSFHGVAHVGYIPGEDGRVTGLSKIARVVDLYAKRPQVQERLTGQIADAVMRKLKPRGVIVVIEAEHLCMAMRGVRKPGAHAPPLRRSADSSRPTRHPVPRRWT